MTASENLKSPAAVSKIAEFILLLSAFIIERLYTSFYNSHDKDIIRPDHMERLSFFSFSSIILCLVVSIIFAFSVSRICDRVKLWNLLVLAISVLSSILSLVSSSLLINEVSHFANYSTPSGEIDLCQAMRTSGKRACGHLQVASVCGFSAMFLFVGDGILYYFKLSNRIRIAEAGC